MKIQHFRSGFWIRIRSSGSIRILNTVPFQIRNTGGAVNNNTDLLSSSEARARLSSSWESISAVGWQCSVWLFSRRTTIFNFNFCILSFSHSHSVSLASLESLLVGRGCTMVMMVSISPLVGWLVISGWMLLLPLLTISGEVVTRMLGDLTKT